MLFNFFHFQKHFVFKLLPLTEKLSFNITEPKIIKSNIVDRVYFIILMYFFLIRIYWMNILNVSLLVRIMLVQNKCNKFASHSEEVA